MAITEFKIPTADSALLDITAGPDGNLWFTDYDRNKIGQVTQIPPPITAVPAMTGWRMIILVIPIGAGSLYYLKRRKAAI